MPTIGKKFLGLFSALALAMSASVVAQPGYLCRISGQISKACCCAAKHRPQHEAQVKPAGCCDVIEAAPASVSNVVPDDTRTLVPLALVAEVDTRAFTLRAEPRLTPYHPSPPPRPPGPPRFLAHCSWLI